MKESDIRTSQIIDKFDECIKKNIDTRNRYVAELSDPFRLKFGYTEIEEIDLGYKKAPQRRQP